MLRKLVHKFSKTFPTYDVNNEFYADAQDAKKRVDELNRRLEYLRLKVEVIKHK